MRPSIRLSRLQSKREMIGSAGGTTKASQSATPQQRRAAKPDNNVRAIRGSGGCRTRLLPQWGQAHLRQNFPEARFIVQAGKRYINAHAHKFRLMLLISSL